MPSALLPFLPTHSPIDPSTRLDAGRLATRVPISTSPAKDVEEVGNDIEPLRMETRFCPFSSQKRQIFARASLFAYNPPKTGLYEETPRVKTGPYEETPTTHSKTLSDAALESPFAARCGPRHGGSLEAYHVVRILRTSLAICG
jgi:hypothetical protein